MGEADKPDNAGKVGRIVALVVVILVVLAAIIASVTVKPGDDDPVWDQATALGDPEAKNHFIVYSDLACPYCLAFENTLIENQEQFQQYLTDNGIYFEVRLTDFLYSPAEEGRAHSRYGALAAYCAKEEGLFWDYYDHAVATVWNEFFKEKGKAGFSDLVKKDKSYWADLGHDVGLGESFDNCYQNEETLAEVNEVTERAAKKIKNGLPYFKFNDFEGSGMFDLSHGWSQALYMFEAGLGS